MTEKEMAQVYATLLSVPGMNDTVKIDLRLPRRTVLQLVQVIEKGLELWKEKGSWPMADKDQHQELQQVISDCLEKSGLTDLKQHLYSLNAKI